MSYFLVIGQEVHIDTITVDDMALRSRNTGGVNSTLKREESLAQSLSNNSTVFIKNYGPGSLATSSIRGGSAGHTLVLWNGLPIQNPFLGLLDLSLLDTWGMSEVNLQKGGGSAMWGSGAIGGVINLQQKNKDTGPIYFKNRLVVGSFGRVEEKTELAMRLGKMRFVSTISFLRAENDYDYTIGKDITRTQSNAFQRQSTIRQDLYWTPNSNNEIAFHYWRSRADRQSPPTSTQNESQASQQDGADRFSLHWKHFSGNHKTTSRTAYFVEDLDYYDPLQGITSLTHFETFLADVDHEIWFASSHVFQVGISHFRTVVSSPANYETAATEVKSAVFATYSYKWAQVSVRQEVVDGVPIPIVPSIGAEIPILKNFKALLKAGRNYRLPTLNDRFWVPGGNPKLLPESGWSQEATLKWAPRTEKWQGGLGITGFNRSIRNWIQWTQDGPLNINEVWSRGLETSGYIAFQRKQWNAKVNAAYDFILSTSLNALSFPKIAAGDQLFYTPVHQGHAGIQVGYRKVSWAYRQQFTGATIGINDDLGAYTTADTNLSWGFAAFRLDFMVRNLWNTQYRIIERRPMPGRNYALAINYTFKKK